MFNTVAFLSYALITTFTPGPNNIMSMSNASKFGFSKSIKFNVGIFVGFFLVILLCSIFSMSVYSLIPTIKPIMTLIGAVYILWLAWKTLKDAPSGPEDDKNTNSFQAGMLLQFVNPKVILYGITTVSTFVIPYSSAPAVLLAFAIFLAFLGFTATCCWALFGAVFQKVLAENGKFVNIIMSALLVYCAVSLFI